MRTALTLNRKEKRVCGTGSSRGREGEARDGEGESGLTNDDDDGNLEGLGEDEMMRVKPERFRSTVGDAEAFRGRRETF